MARRLEGRKEAVAAMNSGGKVVGVGHSRAAVHQNRNREYREKEEE